jgi:hypothetical protein
MECAKEDEVHLAKTLLTGVPNPLLDLKEFDEEMLARDGSGTNEGVKGSRSNATNANLIRRFNQHSTMVLEAAEAKQTG